MTTTGTRPKWDRIYKIVVVGDSGVGKTSYIQRLVFNEFQESNTTIGVEFGSKTFTLGSVPKQVKIQVWDTAGRERYHSISRSLWRGAHGVIFIYDITNPNSFENLLLHFQDLQTHGSPDVHCLLIGTKADLESKKAVEEDEGQKLADSMNAHFAEVSSKTGQNIEESFMDYLKAMHEHLDDILPEPIHKTSSPSISTSQTLSWWDSIKSVLGFAYNTQISKDTFTF